MIEEIAVAVHFINRIVRLGGRIPKDKVEEFSKTLMATMMHKFKNHWYTDMPSRGQCYRCIRISPQEPIDSVIEQVAGLCGLSYFDLSLPRDLTLWVDPNDVCCRFGDDNKELCTLLTLTANGKLESRAQSVDIRRLMMEQEMRFTMNHNIVSVRTNFPNRSKHVKNDQNNNSGIIHNSSGHRMDKHHYVNENMLFSIVA